jgi:hypothetical protein
MTREEKVEKKKLRANLRRQKNRERNGFDQDSSLPMRARRQIAKKGHADAWEDPDSPTGYTQVCSYWATCQSPCNGDC